MTGAARPEDAALRRSVVPLSSFPDCGQKFPFLYRLFLREGQRIWRFISDLPAAGDNGRFVSLTIRGKAIAGLTIGASRPHVTRQWLRSMFTEASAHRTQAHRGLATTDSGFAAGRASGSRRGVGQDAVVKDALLPGRSDQVRLVGYESCAGRRQNVSKTDFWYFW
jgi:hypothetical protein